MAITTPKAKVGIGTAQYSYYYNTINLCFGFPQTTLFSIDGVITVFPYFVSGEGGDLSDDPFPFGDIINAPGSDDLRFDVPLPRDLRSIGSGFEFWGDIGEGLTGDVVGGGQGTPNHYSGPPHADIQDTIGITIGSLEPTLPDTSVLYMPPGWMYWQRSEIVIFTTNRTFVPGLVQPANLGPYGDEAFDSNLVAGEYFSVTGDPPSYAKAKRGGSVMLTTMGLYYQNPTSIPYITIAGNLQHLSCSFFGCSGSQPQQVSWIGVNRQHSGTLIMPIAVRTSFVAVRIPGASAPFGPTEPGLGF